MAGMRAVVGLAVLVGGAAGPANAIELQAARVDPVAAIDRLMRAPGSRYIDFLIPGLLGMNLMGSAFWGMGFAIF